MSTPPPIHDDDDKTISTTAHKQETLFLAGIKLSGF
jgi:hypothetical protein